VLERALNQPSWEVFLFRGVLNCQKKRDLIYYRKRTTCRGSGGSTTTLSILSRTLSRKEAKPVSLQALNDVSQQSELVVIESEDVNSLKRKERENTKENEKRNVSISVGLRLKQPASGSSTRFTFPRKNGWLMMTMTLPCC